MADSILYAEENNNIFVRAVGRMTANICYEYRQRIFARLNAVPPVENIFIDLSRCEYMDSTFMGIILGINKKLKKIRPAGVTVVCPTDECNLLFSGLNILNLFSVDEKLVRFPPEMELISQFEKLNPEIVLHAHDDLAEISDVNADKFKLLREILQKKVIDERRKEMEEREKSAHSDDGEDGSEEIDDSNKLTLEDI